MSSKVYVGGLGNSGDKQELWRLFSKYGALRDVWVARSPPGFAFVEFEDVREAEDAVHALDGRRLGDKKIRVEFSKTRNRGGGRGGGRRGDRGRYDRSHDFQRGDDYGSRGNSDQRFQQTHRRSSPPRSQDHSPQARYDHRRSRSRSPIKH